MPQVQRVPVAAHHGDRPGGQAARGADPHPRHAPHGRVRHRRALAVQGEPRAATIRRHAAAEIDDMAWLRQLLDWQREAADPGEFLDSLRYDLAAQEIFVFTPKGDVIALPTGPPRSTSPTRCTPRSATAASAPGSTAGWSPLERKLDNGDSRRDLHLEGARRRPVAGLAGLRASPRGPRPRSGSGSPRSAARRRSSRARTPSPGRCASGGLPLQRLMTPTSLVDARPRPALRRRRRAVRGGRREPRLGAQSVVQRLVAELGGDEERRRGPRRDAVPPGHHAGCASAAPTTPASSVQGAPGLWVKLAKCCTPVPGDDIIGFVTRGGGVSVHRTDCTNADALQQQAGAARRRGVGAVAGVGVPGRHPGRGARPAPAALRRHPGAGRRAGQHPVGVGHHHPTTGWRSAGSPSRWPTPSTSGTCSTRSATSRASTTSTGSPARPDRRRRRGHQGIGDYVQLDIEPTRLAGLIRPALTRSSPPLPACRRRCRRRHPPRRSCPAVASAVHRCCRRRCRSAAE